MKKKELLQAIYDTLQGMASNQVKTIGLLEKACGLLAENVLANESTAGSADKVCGYTLLISKNTAPVEWPEDSQFRESEPKEDLQKILKEVTPAQFKGRYAEWFMKAADSVLRREGIEGLRNYVICEFPEADAKKKAHAVYTAIQAWRKAGKLGNEEA